VLALYQVRNWQARARAQMFYFDSAALGGFLMQAAAA
jgi:hypothetical protein